MAKVTGVNTTPIVPRRVMPYAHAGPASQATAEATSNDGVNENEPSTLASSSAQSQLLKPKKKKTIPTGQLPLSAILALGFAAHDDGYVIAVNQPCAHCQASATPCIIPYLRYSSIEHLIRRMTCKACRTNPSKQCDMATHNAFLWAVDHASQRLVQRLKPRQLVEKRPSALEKWKQSAWVTPPTSSAHAGRPEAGIAVSGEILAMIPEQVASSSRVVAGAATPALAAPMSTDPADDDEYSPTHPASSPSKITKLADKKAAAARLNRLTSTLAGPTSPPASMSVSEEEEAMNRINASPSQKISKSAAKRAAQARKKRLVAAAASATGPNSIAVRPRFTLTAEPPADQVSASPTPAAPALPSPNIIAKPSKQERGLARQAEAEARKAGRASREAPKKRKKMMSACSVSRATQLLMGTQKECDQGLPALEGAVPSPVRAANPTASLARVTSATEARERRLAALAAADPSAPSPFAGLWTLGSSTSHPDAAAQPTFDGTDYFDFAILDKHVYATVQALLTSPQYASNLVGPPPITAMREPPPHMFPPPPAGSMLLHEPPPGGLEPPDLRATALSNALVKTLKQL